MDRRRVAKELLKASHEILARDAEWPDYELDGIWDDKLRLRTTLSWSGMYLEDMESLHDVNQKEMAKVVEGEAGRIIDGLRKILSRHGLEVSSGLRVTNLYNPSRDRLSFPFLVEVSLRSEKLDMGKLRSELERALR